MRLHIITIVAFLLVWRANAQDKLLDISGRWTVQLDTADIGIEQGWFNKTLNQKIELPGTTDDAKLGNPDTLPLALVKPQLSHLTRKYRYVGVAWYTREI